MFLKDLEGPLERRFLDFNIPHCGKATSFIMASAKDTWAFLGEAVPGFEVALIASGILRPFE